MKREAVSGTETRGTASRIARPDMLWAAVIRKQPLGQFIHSVASAVSALHLETSLRGTTVSSARIRRSFKPRAIDVSGPFIISNAMKRGP